MGRDYPQGYDHFKTRLHAAFVKKRDLTDPLQIQQAIQQGNYIVKELEALYFLSKYRELKRRYDTSPDNAFMYVYLFLRLIQSRALCRMEVMESKLAKLSTADPQR